MRKNVSLGKVEVQEDVEITAAMIQVGVDEFRAHYPDTAVGDVLDRQMITAIYETMRARQRARRAS